MKQRTVVCVEKRIDKKLGVHIYGECVDTIHVCERDSQTVYRKQKILRGFCQGEKIRVGQIFSENISKILK